MSKRPPYRIGRRTGEPDAIKREAINAPPGISIWEYSFWPPCENGKRPDDAEWGMLHVVMNLGSDYGTHNRATLRTRDWQMIAQLIGSRGEDVDLGGIYQARPGWPDDYDGFAMDDEQWTPPQAMFTGGPT